MLRLADINRPQTTLLSNSHTHPHTDKHTLWLSRLLTYVGLPLSGHLNSHAQVGLGLWKHKRTIKLSCSYFTETVSSKWACEFIFSTSPLSIGEALQEATDLEWCIYFLFVYCHVCSTSVATCGLSQVKLYTAFERTTQRLLNELVCMFSRCDVWKHGFWTALVITKPRRTSHKVKLHDN